MNCILNGDTIGARLLMVGNLLEWHMDTGRRTITKALIWNVIGLIVMAIVGYIATGSLAKGGGIAAVNTIIGLVTYIVYERVWSRIDWGIHGQ